MLVELDDVRAQAFANADPGLLDRVYVASSSARAVDAAMIADYRRRGAHVIDADLTVLSSKVEAASADRVTLDVVDQLDAAQVVWSDGTTRQLPRDLPTRRVVTLVRTPDGWRIG